MTIIRIQKSGQVGRSYVLPANSEKFWTKFYRSIESVESCDILSDLFMTVVKAEMNPSDFNPSSVASQHRRRGYDLKELIITFGKEDVHFTAAYVALNNLAEINAYGQEDASGVLNLFSVFVATNLNQK